MMNKILLKNESPPFTIYNGDSLYPIILTVEHASNRIPRHLKNLGLDQKTRETHIAYDLFTKDIALEVSLQLKCPLITSEYSRLVIDCNRLDTSPQLICTQSNGIKINGNKNISKEEIEQRIKEIYLPFHRAIKGVKERYEKNKTPFSIISLHSFTHCLETEKKDRPWDIGLLWDQDNRLAIKLYDFLVQNYPMLNVGYNVPFDARIEEKGSLHIHAYPYQIPAIEIELNQRSLLDRSKYNCILRAFVKFIKLGHANNLLDI